MTVKEKYDIYQNKSALQYLYKKWYSNIKQNLANGITLEIGSGFGLAKKYIDCITSEYIVNEFVDQKEDAHNLSFADSSLDNIIGIDVLHHLNNLTRFLSEAKRVLNTGGRFVFVEPYCSPFSTLVRRMFHHESLDLNILEKQSLDPNESNLAAPTILFARFTAEKQSAYLKKLMVKKLILGDCIVYPLSGGYKNISLLPDRILNATIYFERMIEKNYCLPKLLAFKMLIVCEKQ